MNEDRLNNLLSLYQERQSQGETVDPVDLCRECPELLDELNQRIRFLRDVDVLVQRGSPGTKVNTVVETGPVQTGADAKSTRTDTPKRPRAGLSGVVNGYEIRAELGRGGMGIVYRALDRERGLEVALKTLQGFTPQALYRFKQEFRLLADISHPNLVSLFELVSDGDFWFFTMELLQGVDFLSFVRPATSGTTAAKPAETLAADDASCARLRDGLIQLAEGLTCLHDAGKLHRDLKPSNILVTTEGRVVILDFGLVADLGQQGRNPIETKYLMGTVAYMSPEQAHLRPVTAATDWYSVGVIVYEALTGRPPFTGSSAQVFQDKEQLTPVSPHELTPGLPEDLVSLCMELLRHDPAARPQGREVLRRLKNQSTPGSLEASHPEKPILLGRDRHLQVLINAWDSVREGQSVVVYVSGRSGMGKSALLQTFLEPLVADKDTVILAGQCYEQESVPYKAFDSLIDALSRYLEQLPPAERLEVLPDDLPPLARLFPVLRQVETPVGLKPEQESPDPREMRRRAFAALRELLTRIGKRACLVLAIDDLQWGDVDSVGLFFELLRPPSPRLLFLGSYRSEEASASPFLQAVLAPAHDTLSTLDRRELVVDVLPFEDARRLAIDLFGAEQPRSNVEVDAVARESGGNPLFLYELVQSARASGSANAAAERSTSSWEGAGNISLSRVLWTRIQGLPEEPRRLLKILAVAGRPLRASDAFRAADIGPEHRAFQSFLRSARLLRTTGTAKEWRVESGEWIEKSEALRSPLSEMITTYHDRVRETITSQLPAEELQACHGRLAQVLEESGQVEPEALAGHFLAARQPEKAISYYHRAAEKAVAAMAFDRAAGFYQTILNLQPDPHPESGRLRALLADALANARRGTEAAPLYLQAAATATPAEALELRRRAVEQYLFSGHLDDGRAVLRTLLASLGMKLPKSPLRALFSILVHRFRLWLRGFDFCERPAQELSPEELLRLDTCWTIGLGLSHVDPIYGTEFLTRYLLMALRAGEPSRILRGLAIEMGQRARGGRQSQRRADRLLQTTLALAEKVNQPYGFGLTELSQGASAFLDGRWKEARDHSERGEKILREQCAGAACEWNEANFYAIRSLEFLGELTELSARLPVLLQDAHDRGDLYAATNLQTRLAYLVSLMRDQTDQAQRDLCSAIERWSHQGFFLQHYFELYAQMDILQYRGDHAAAWAFVNDRWGSLKRSLLLLVQSSRITSLHFRARSALGLAALASTTASARRKLLRSAERDIARIARENVGWSNPIAWLLRSGSDALQGRMRAAESLLRAAESGFQKLDMTLYAAVARRRLGQVVGGETGQKLVAEAERWMHGQSIVNPARWTMMYAPGFPMD